MLEDILIRGINPISVFLFGSIDAGTSVSRGPLLGNMLGIVNVFGKSVNEVA